MQLKNLTSSETLEFWKQTLWKDRQDPVQAMSSMVFPKGYDMQIYEKYQPTFWGLLEGDRLVGVQSGHRTSETHYRCRGLFVAEDHRGRGLSQILLSAVQNQALQEGCQLLWTYPRKDAWFAYEKFGFRIELVASETHLVAAKEL